MSFNPRTYNPNKPTSFDPKITSQGQFTPQRVSNDSFSSTFTKDYFPTNNQLSVQQEKCMTYKKKISYLAINSKDRDTSLYPQPQSYTINLDGDVGMVYKNVVSVRLISGTVPDINNVRDEPFLILDIDELANAYTRYRGTNNVFANMFDMVRFVDKQTLNKFVYITEGPLVEYFPPIAKLSKLTIKFLDQEGNTFSWGDDTTLALFRQNSLVFEITEMIANVDKLGTRGVF